VNGVVLSEVVIGRRYIERRNDKRLKSLPPNGNIVGASGRHVDVGVNTSGGDA
jgi:hypothetical protein